MKKVLAVLANPSGSTRLRLDAEQRAISECIKRSRYRDAISLRSCPAATVDDVRRALLEDDYTIVHFSGHGTRSGLVFEDTSQAWSVPPMEALADLLAEYAPPLECVLLNACYSVHQGRFMSMGVPFTIGMEQPISDHAAIDFSAAFYDSIGAGKDIAFSFRQGVHQLRLASSPDRDVPVLLRRDETHVPAAVTPVIPAQSTVGVTPKRLLVGLALDVSGSMEESFDNRDGDVRTRLESVRRSLSRFADADLRTNVSPEASALIFGYAFGLRSKKVCDLFSLIKAADDVMTPEEARGLGEQYAAELRAQYSGGGWGDLGGLARQFGLGTLVDQAEDLARHEIKQRVAQEAQRRLNQRLAVLGDSTLDIRDFARLWQGSSERLADAEPLIYGDTPMRTALTAVRDRFAREFEKVSDVNALLLLVSDGDPTDGDPEPVAAQIRDMGVTIVSCYLTNFDLASPKRMLNRESPDWPDGAARLFRMASRLDVDSPLSRRLLREGWTIEPHAACFVQVNHSDALNGFVRALPPPAPGRTAVLPKGR